jgi:hypothetical protein
VGLNRLSYQYRGLFIDQPDHRVYSSEIIQFEVFIFDAELEFSLDKENQLHGKHRIDEACLENVFIVLQFVIAKDLCEEDPEFSFDFVHGKLSSVVTDLVDQAFVGVETAPVFASIQSRVNHLLQQRTWSVLVVVETLVEHFE